MTRDVPDDAPLTRLLPLILLACVTWVGVAGVRGWMHWTGSLADGLDIAAAVLPPMVGALFAVALFRRARRPEYAGVADRLAAAGSEAMAIEGRLRALDATLGGSLAQTERMAEAASAHGSGLGASATALGLAATRLVDAGEDADRAAALLAERIPDLGRQVGELDAVLRRLGSDTAQQILAIDTLLAKVGVRSRETGAEAGAVIGAIVKQLAAVDEHSRTPRARSPSAPTPSTPPSTACSNAASPRSTTSAHASPGTPTPSSNASVPCVWRSTRPASTVPASSASASTG